MNKNRLMIGGGLTLMVIHDWSAGLYSVVTFWMIGMGVGYLAAAEVHRMIKARRR